MSSIAISLVAHTNVGKTTLARSLLGRDVGEVRDESHVTLVAEPHLLVDTPQGDRLALWDTPGFGDSVRLARRIATAGQPLGWFMSQVWDRLRDRAFWSSQQAVRHVLERTDVVLYLVNAAEAPEDARYLAAELEVLALTGKPVLALLNQLGSPRPPAEEAAGREAWRRHLATHAIVREVLPLDAFTGCWVQAAALFEAIARCLPAPSREAFDRLSEVRRQRDRKRWHDAMDLLAGRLARAAADRQVVDGEGLAARLKDVGHAIGLRGASGTPREQAMQALAHRQEAELRSGTDALIRLHELDGRAGDQVLQALAEHFAGREPLTEGKAALFGGMAAGALAGLKADIATGGLTLGGGLLAGGLIGALGGAGLARGYNLVRGVSVPTLAWNDLALDEFARGALLGYLAVIHHGRGRGPWDHGVTPGFWREAVDAAVSSRSAALHALWDGLRQDGPATAALAAEMVELSRAVLARLYPTASPGVLALNRT